MRPFGAVFVFTFRPLSLVGTELNDHRAAQRRIKDHFLRPEA
jgi:hypothetical protein